MGFIQMGFGASQVLGVPIGLYLANHWGWEAPFWLIVAMSIIIALLILIKLKPVVQHLLAPNDKSAFAHLWHTLKTANYRIGFTATALLSIGGFMMMPFGSAFAVNNLGVSYSELPMLFMLSGVSSLVIMPLIGRLSDRMDKFKIFAMASIWMMLMCVIYTNLSTTPFWLVVVLNILMMMGIMSRMIPSSALTSAIPELKDRGAFMSINASLQQIAGGVAAALSGMIVIQKSKGSPLIHYNTVGYLIVVISIVSIFLMWRVHNLVKKQQ